MSKRMSALVLSAVFAASAAASPVFSQKTNVKDETDRALAAAAVLDEVMQVPEQAIPQKLLDRSYAIAVIPHVVKGAFGVGGRHGKGLIAARTKAGKWGAPSFIDISGGSFGFQLGVSATDLVLVFTDQGGLKGLLAGKMKFGVDAAAAAGPVGRTAEAGTDVKLKSAIYSYSRAKGLFAGVSLDGAALTIDDSANQKVYGIGVTGSDILINNKVRSAKIVQPFLASLGKHAPRLVK